MLPRLLSLLMILACLCGCLAPPSRPLTVWTALEGQELETFKAQVKVYSQQAQVRVDVLKVPFAELLRKFLIAAPADQGPDLILGPQDWLGVFATAKLLEPFELPEPGDFTPVAISGVTSQGKVYALPLLLDCLLLLRNEELAPRSPKNLDELLSYATEIKKNRGAEGIEGFYFDFQEFYFAWPFFAGSGATVFDEKTLQVGFCGEAGVEALGYLTELRSRGLIPRGASNDFAKSFFLDKKLAMTLNGPWFLGDVRQRNIPCKIEVIPPGKQTSSPFVGVLCLMLNARTTHRSEAQALMAHLSKAEPMVAMSLASGRPPARKTALLEVAKDPVKGPDILAVARVTDSGVALPNHPAAAAIWEPMKQAIELVTKGEAQPKAELERVQARIAQKIKLMME